MGGLQDPIPVIAPSSARTSELFGTLSYHRNAIPVDSPADRRSLERRAMPLFLKLGVYISLAGLTEAGSDARGGNNFGARF